MKIICTEQERENIINAFNAWCPFDTECPYKSMDTSVITVYWRE